MKLFFLLFLLPLSSDDRIPFRELSWSDFRGKVPANETTVAARTTAQLVIGTGECGGVFTFDVKAYFLPDSSFVRIKSDLGLRHEQTHFRIAHIEALKCMLALEPLQHGDAAAQSKAEALYEHFYEEMVQIDDQFDSESNHSQNAEQEKIWEDRIARELHTLETPSTQVHGRNR